MNFSEENDITPSDIRKIVLNTPEPLRLQNLMKSDLVSWSLNDWDTVLTKELLEFRCGKYNYTIEPQWEAKCINKQATFQDFLAHVEHDSDEWWYFDYKYLSEWFTDKEVLKGKINWSSLGFPEVTANDCTLWIGSKGAHTSCHMDTYGCNLILQVYGRKEWILFPPEENLKPTRIPFEESSIYSKLNFFSPKEADFKGISHCRKVVLNPGDVLVLPHRWWHYVENLETAISINVWLPLPEDDMARMKESIATIFVGQMIETKNCCKDIILNPNMKQIMVTTDEALDIITATLDKCRPTNKIFKADHQSASSKQDDYAKRILSKCEQSKIPILSREEFRLFLCTQAQRFPVTENCRDEDKNLHCKNLINFLEAITDDEVLSLIAKKLTEKR